MMKEGMVYAQSPIHMFTTGIPTSPSSQTVLNGGTDIFLTSEVEFTHHSEYRHVFVSGCPDRACDISADDSIRVTIFYLNRQMAPEVITPFNYASTHVAIDLIGKLYEGESHLIRIEAIDRSGADKSLSPLYLVVDTENNPVAENGAPYELIQEGDIIVSRDTNVLFSKIMRKGLLSYWTHASLVVKDEIGELKIAEAYGTLDPDGPLSGNPFLLPDPGVVVVDVEDSQPFNWDGAAIYRPTQSASISSYALEQKGDPYNWNFFDKYTEDSFYCSQLVWAAYFRNGGTDFDDRIDLPLNTPSWLKWIQTPIDYATPTRIAVTPDDLVQDLSKVTLVGHDGNRHAMLGIGYLIDGKTSQVAAASLSASRLITSTGPASMQLRGEDGNVIGTDPETGSVVEILDTINYVEQSNGFEFFTFLDIGESWELEIAGNGTGEYVAILVDVINPNNTKFLTGTVATGIRNKYDLTFDENGFTSIPHDQVPPETQISLVGILGLNEWYVSDVTVTLSATDEGVGVRLTEYSTDGGSTWQTYSQPIQLGEGVNDFRYRSTDHVNNREDVKPRTIKVDYTPPQTIAYATGPLDINQMFRDNVTASLVATDNLSGVGVVEYSTDNKASWQAFETDNVEFSFNGNGVSQFYFRATDSAGNIETTKDSGPIIINRYALFGNNSATAVEVDRSTSVLIDGDVHSNGSAKFTFNTGVTIDGLLTTKNGVTSNGNTSLSIPASTNGVQVAMLHYPKAYFIQNADVVHNGNLTMYDTSSVISGTMHVKGNMTIYGTTVAGDGVIVVDGNIYDYSTVSTVVSQAPGTGVVLYSGQNIELYGTSNYGVGMMYAPNGTITVHSTDLDMNGSLVANRVFFDRATSANVTYSAAFASGTYTLPITSAYVEPPLSVIPSSKGTLFDSMEPTIGYGRAYGVTTVEQSSQYPSEGNKSLKVTTNGSFGHFTRWLGNQNWGGLQQLEVHVVNPSDSRARIMLALTRNGQWYQSTSQTVGPKSAAILTFNLAGISGLTNVNSFGFVIEGDPAKTLFFDNVRRLGITVIPSTNGQLYDSMEITINWGRSQGVTALAQSTEYPSDGSKSLKVTTNGTWGNFNRWLGTQNWSTYKQVEVHVVNPSDTPAKVMMLLTRTTGGWYQSSAQTVQPKSAAILRYNLSAITGLNSVSSFGFIVDAGPAKDLYFDNIRRNTTIVASSFESEGGITIFLPIVNR